MSLGWQQLDKTVQRWVHQQGWADLRPIQQKSIPPILAGDQDVIISASTASGKTEAFFLPACSAVLTNADAEAGFSMLYISPLKALINDQYRRLQSLCELAQMPLTPWHGDSSQAKKRQAKKVPSGILLITPESLESLLVRESGWVRQAFSGLRYSVIDEFHAFIGTERGHHLLSLLARLDALIARPQTFVPRVALSATLGELDKVPQSLRPNSDFPYTIITDDQSQATLKLQLRGYIDPVDLQPDDHRNPAKTQICRDLYQLCRGDSHLIFANSRQRTEAISARLSDLCQQQHVPNEFFPHHGSLAKELRETLEARLQKESLPTTAVCTMTLELGIDIGKVSSVVQVTAPHSVSSLRQRLGRSGRRDSPAILRMLITEPQLTVSANVVDQLRMELLQSIAMLRLLVANQWFEPADTEQLHFSTMLHQILALVAQWGGVRADQLYVQLCQIGPFQHVSVSHFKQLLNHMGSTELLIQLGSGELVLGVKGEKVVDHYTFYCVFKTPEEYRIVANGKTLGTLPIDTPMITGQLMVFGGRRWQIQEIDGEKKTIYVAAAKGGNPPSFGGESMIIHDRIRQEMLTIVKSGEYRIPVGDRLADFIDETAKELFNEGHQYFKAQNLAKQFLIQQGERVCLIPWIGDKKINTLVVLLMKGGFKASAFAGVIEIEQSLIHVVKRALCALLSQTPPSNTELAECVADKYKEKYDEFLPEALLNEGYGRRMFDIVGTYAWIADSLDNMG